MMATHTAKRAAGNGFGEADDLYARARAAQSWAELSGFAGTAAALADIAAGLASAAPAPAWPRH